VRYRFGDFELDGFAYTLKRKGDELAVQRKVFDVLRYLLEHQGRVVTKNELLEALWAGEHVNEGAVPWSIYHARRALGQERTDKSPIETVHGRGYRLIANVEVLQSPRARSVPPPSVPPAGQASASQPAPLLESTLPFVGREDVMQQLEGRLTKVQGGEGGLVLLVGESGIGKTRCAEELRALAWRRGVSTWSGRSVEGVGMAGLETGRSPDQSPDREGTDRFWVLDGVSRFLIDAARQLPAVVVLDDLHWADSATIELLTFLAPELRRSALMVIATSRPEAVDQERRRGARLLRGAEVIELKHLTPEDVKSYIAELSEEAPPLELCRAVHRATAGNPLFLQETVRSLMIEHGDDKLGTLAESAIVPSQVARDALHSRLAGIDPEALEVLTTASVLGESFELAILQRLSDRPLDALLAALERACRAGLLHSDGPHRYRFAHALLRSILYDDMPGSQRVATHRRAAEQLSELSQAAPRHSEIAHHYYRSLPAGDYGKVVSAASHAAKAAERMQAFADAVPFYQWALEAQALDPETTPRERAALLFAYGSAQRAAGHDRDSRKTLSTVIELARQHGYSDMLLRAARVLRPTHQIGALPDPLVRSALEEVLKLSPAGQGRDDDRIAALSQLACIPPYGLDLRRSAELSGEALALARKQGSRLLLIEALRARLHSLSGPDDIDALLDTATEMLELDDRRNWPSMEAQLARMGAYLYRGDLLAAEAALREFERVAREGRLPEAIWYHDRVRSQRKLAEGDFAGAEAASKELRSRAQRMGLSYGPAFIDMQLNAIASARRGIDAAREWNIGAIFAASGEIQSSYRARLVLLAAELGRTDEARRMLESMSLQDYEDLPKDIGYVNALTQLGRAAAILGERGRAQQLYDLLLPYAHHNTPSSMLFYEGSASYSLGQLAAALGHHDRVAAHFEAALAMNERLEMKPWVGRTHYAYAVWLSDRGETARAREHARRAVELADAVGMPWLSSLASKLA
jgi:DNA-binding winged helix-turn-helix (wHTH) protein/tetratricopeptide (TPR) repeat protein